MTQESTDARALEWLWFWAGLKLVLLLLLLDATQTVVLYQNY